MRVFIETIPEEGLHLDGEILASDILFDLPGYELIEPITITGTAVKVGEDVNVDATLHGQVNCECSRCLKSFTMAISLDFNVVYAPETERPKDETEIIEPDANLAFYKGDTVELLHEVRDLLLTHMPINPVCQEHCRGLCPVCGTDLNEAQCACAQKLSASPFEKLKEIRSKLKER
ncbi:MAG: DUF177 domain-containing protein [Candidatus Abyssubacteria bacterium]